MPDRIVLWKCSTCLKMHPSYDKAFSCETDHIIFKVNDDFKNKLSSILKKD